MFVYPSVEVSSHIEDHESVHTSFSFSVFFSLDG